MMASNAPPMSAIGDNDSRIGAESQAMYIEYERTVHVFVGHTLSARVYCKQLSKSHGTVLQTHLYEHTQGKMHKIGKSKVSRWAKGIPTYNSAKKDQHKRALDEYINTAMAQFHADRQMYPQNSDTTKRMPTGSKRPLSATSFSPPPDTKRGKTTPPPGYSSTKELNAEKALKELADRKKTPSQGRMRNMAIVIFKNFYGQKVVPTIEQMKGMRQHMLDFGPQHQLWESSAFQEYMAAMYPKGAEQIGTDGEMKILDDGLVQLLALATMDPLAAHKDHANKASPFGLSDITESSKDEYTHDTQRSLKILDYVSGV